VAVLESVVAVDRLLQEVTAVAAGEGAPPATVCRGVVNVSL
jgi:hypothetical protein